MFLNSTNSKIESVLHTTSNVPSLNTINITFDSGTSSSYVRQKDAKILQELTPHTGPAVRLPDADRIKPSRQGILPLSHMLSKEAQRATVLPKLQSSTLVLCGKLSTLSGV